MKKLLSVITITLASLYATNTYSYTFRITNNTDGVLSAYLDTIGGYNYTSEIQPGQTWEVGTALYCIRGVGASGRSGSIKGLYIYKNVPGITCKDYNINVVALNQRIDRMTGISISDSIDMYF
jgi:hypothetical protein